MALKRRIAVVGLGSIGWRHARLLCERPDVSVELVEPDPERLKTAQNKLGNLPGCHAFEQMLGSPPEMVLIATPHSVHAAQTIQALEAGAHVLCEKPMSDNFEDALKMKEAADKSGKVLNIGFNLHFHPGLNMLKDVIDQGVLGSIVHAHARVGAYVTLVNSVSRYQGKQAGALFFDYAHQPDIFFWFFRQKPVAVYVSALQAGNLDFSSNPNVALINCEYETPLVSSIHLNYVQMPLRHEYEVVGDKAWAVLDMTENTLRIGKRDGVDFELKKFSVDRDDLYRAEHQAFLEAVQGKRRPETPAGDGLVSAAICTAALKSWQEHARVGVEDVG